MGLAAARMEVRAFSVVMIPALAIETVCCSCRESARVQSLSSEVSTYHDLVQDGTCGVGHLVKLVDAADTTV